LADVDRQLADSPIESSQNFPPPTLPISEILADINRQLIGHPGDAAPAPHAEVPSANAGQDTLAKMDAHVRSILAGNSSRLFALNTALGHNLPLPPLTEESIHNEIAEMYAAYYGGSSDDDEDEAETEVRWANLPHCTPQLSPETQTVPPPSTRPYVTTSTPRSDLGIRCEAISQAMDEPRDTRATESSSSEPTLPTLRPRASWMIDDGDERTEAQADADWHRANTWLRTPPPTSFLSSGSSVPTPIMPTPTPIMPTQPLPHEGAQHQPWGNGPPHVAIPPVAHGWQLPQWAAHEGEPEPEPQPRLGAPIAPPLMTRPTRIYTTTSKPVHPSKVAPP
jgi:hypothetical protein